MYLTLSQLSQLSCTFTGLFLEHIKVVIVFGPLHLSHLSTWNDFLFLFFFWFFGGWLLLSFRS